nr:alkaline phosphatase [uncultured Carboxylicivirga sp.]
MINNIFNRMASWGGALILLVLVSCQQSANKDGIIDEKVHEVIVDKESGYWFKRSLAHALYNRLISEDSQVLWSTNFHTAAPVPLGAVGPQKYLKKLQGIVHNDYLGRVLKQAVNEGTNVILVIGDGMGNMHMALPVYKRYAEKSDEKTYFERIMAEGTCGYLYTSTARGLVTGSAASGTAIATGSKSLMNMVGLDTLGNALQSLMELSKSKGYFNTIISDAGITDATPAAFYAHTANRDWESDIAFQLAKSKCVDVVLGGGGSQFLPQGKVLCDYYSGSEYPDYHSSRKDSLNLFAQLKSRDFQLCFTLNELNSVVSGKVIGLFEGGGLPPAIDYNSKSASIPTVTQMAQKGLALSKESLQPTCTMIECARIDWEAHDNDVVSVYKAVEEMNNVLKIAYNQYRSNPAKTLLVFTADHETGGLEIAYKKEHTYEKRTLSDNVVWENNTNPLHYHDYIQMLEGQDRTLSSIFASSGSAEELKQQLEKHAKVHLTSEEAALLFYARNGYQKYKKE